MAAKRFGRLTGFLDQRLEGCAVFGEIRLFEQTSKRKISALTMRVELSAGSVNLQIDIRMASHNAPSTTYATFGDASLKSLNRSS